MSKEAVFSCADIDCDVTQAALPKRDGVPEIVTLVDELGWTVIDGRTLCPAHVPEIVLPMPQSSVG